MDGDITNGERKKNRYEKLSNAGRFPATGIVALESRMITRDQFDAAVKQWTQAKEAGAEISFEDVLVKKEMISPEKMMQLIPATIRKMNLEFGGIVVKKGLVSESYIEKALKVQAEKYKSGELVLLSDLLIRARLLSDGQRDEIYGIQNTRTLDWIQSYDGSRRFGEKSEDIRNNKKFQHELAQGELAVTYQFITGEQLKTGLDLLEKAYKKGLKISLDRILFEKGFLDEKSVLLLKETKFFLETRDLDSQFLLLAIESNILDRATAKAILEKQTRGFEKVHKCISAVELILEDELMTRDQCNAILIKQKRAIPNGNSKITEVNDAEIIKRLDDDTALNEDDALVDLETAVDIIVNIGSDYLVAEIIIPDSYPTPITLDDIKNLLQERSIVSGIVSDAVIKEKLACENSQIRRFDAAIGQPAEPGKNAQLIVHFQREYLNPGKVTDDGFIDFKDRGPVPFISKGDLLAEIIPKKPGQPGEDIYGTDLPAPPVSDVTVAAGKGAELSENGLKIFASEDGQPGMTVAGEISVFQEFKVDGDVDFNTGNIVFDGHITVTGAVKEGFSVTGGSLTAGAVDGSRIELTGNLEVSIGIVNADITAGGNVQAMYVADSSIESYGDVIIKKEIIDSKISTSGSCKSEGTTIVASTISTLQGIEAAQIGTEVSEKCVLRVGVDFHTENEIKKHMVKIETAKALLEAKQAEIEKNEKEQSGINEMISSTAHALELAQEGLQQLENETATPDSGVAVSDGSLTPARKKQQILLVINEAESTIQKYFNDQEKLMYLAEQGRGVCGLLVETIEKCNLEIREIKQWLKRQKKDAVVTVTKALCQGTVISGPNAAITIEETCRHSSVRELAGDLTKGETHWLMKIIPD